MTNALPKLNFQPSQPIGGGGSEAEKTSQAEGQAFLSSVQNAPLSEKIIVGVILLAIFASIFALLDPEARKKVLRAFFQSMLYGLVVAYLVKTQVQWFTGIASHLDLAVPEIASLLAPQQDLPAPVFTPPQEQNWLSFAIGLGILFLVGLIVWQIYRSKTRIAEADHTLDDFASIARNSLENLKAGKNYENTIVECYERMNEIAARKRGVHRQQASTPSEFSAQLARAGLPHGSVQTLTLLFEAVRYGKKSASSTEIEQATECLSAILRYCGEANA